MVMIRHTQPSDIPSGFGLDLCDLMLTMLNDARTVVPDDTVCACTIEVPR
jgi:hypothetical protein